MEETVSIVESGRSGEPVTQAPAPAAGGTIGRFLLLGTLGRGGMGVVLSAYDPVLDRRVALKLLRPRGSGDATRGRVRLRREAQAMARLSHPNVVAVHDVGEVAGQLFIAMEHIDGPTLRAWCAERARPWREIVAMFAAAGEGLAAAHAAGLVHRDFKPENVLIGSDGRPRVGDFGLVSVREAGEGEEGAPGDGVSETVATGPLVGTPGYISPEQLRGEPTDARSDQFAFCVALYQALYGQRPFVEQPPEAHRRAVMAGELAPAPRQGDVPRWLLEVVTRGLAPDPARRWPSVQALLQQLRRDPQQQRRRRVATVGALLAVAALVAGTRALDTRRGEECRHAAERLQGVWDPGRRQAARRAFEATALPFAAATFERIAATLDAYAAAWVDMHQEACRATRVEGRQSDAALDLRMACLERRRATLAALTAEWSGPVDASALENAITAAASLAPLAPCADARALAQEVAPPSDPAAFARIAMVRAHLDRARALRSAARVTEARREAEAARTEAQATAFPPLQAEAALLVGAVLHELELPGAAEALQEATRLGELGHDDRLVAAAAIELVGALADTGQAPAAIPLGPLAEALVVRAGDDPRQRGALRVQQGSALQRVARYREALPLLTEAQQTLTTALGPNDPLTLQAGERLLGVLRQLGDGPARDQLARQLLEREEEVFGPDHPRVGSLLDRMAQLATIAGDFPGARRLLDRALVIAERTHGPRSIAAAYIHNSFGVLAGEEGKVEEQLRECELVVAIRRELLPPDDPRLAHAIANLGLAWRDEGSPVEAERLIQEALGIMRRRYGPSHVDVAYETMFLGEMQSERGDYAAAEASYRRGYEVYAQLVPEQEGHYWSASYMATFLEGRGRCDEATKLAGMAVAGFERLFGVDNVRQVEGLEVLARCHLRAREAAEAGAQLEQALAIAERQGMAAAKRGGLRLDLARALRMEGQANRAAAVEQQGRRELERAGAVGARELALAQVRARDDRRPAP